MNKIIYLAGGCFWGTEKYLNNIKGVIETEVGYANGNSANPTYEEVSYKNTGHTETVKVVYDSKIISLGFLLKLFYEVIDPTSLNRQGNDVGRQYRSGVYYENEEDKIIILKSLDDLREKYNKPIMIEVLPLNNYYKAEEYHQKYLDKNPNGYCHIDSRKFEDVKKRIDDSIVNLDDPIKDMLSDLEYKVTTENATEAPYLNKYNDNKKPGVYVDITTGEPLFLSSDKFESHCGWPSFAKPIDKDKVIEKNDSSHGMIRTEVRSSKGDIHLGHVFDDGPSNLGGLRYCINSASLLFIPKEEMTLKGYGYLIDKVK